MLSFVCALQLVPISPHSITIGMHCLNCENCKICITAVRIVFTVVRIVFTIYNSYCCNAAVMATFFSIVRIQFNCSIHTIVRIVLQYCYNGIGATEISRIVNCKIIIVNCNCKNCMSVQQNPGYINLGDMLTHCHCFMSQGHGCMVARPR